LDDLGADQLRLKHICAAALICRALDILVELQDKSFACELGLVLATHHRQTLKLYVLKRPRQIIPSSSLHSFCKDVHWLAEIPSDFSQPLFLEWHSDKRLNEQELAKNQSGMCVSKTPWCVM